MDSATLPDTTEIIVNAIKTGLAALLLAAFAGAASAQDLGAVKEMDVSGDGIITKAEAETALVARFKTLDANHDGKVSEDEFVNAGLKRLSAFDKNGDGNVSREELRDQFRNAFRNRFSR
jgi:hypothetical protein